MERARAKAESQDRGLPLFLASPLRSFPSAAASGGRLASSSGERPTLCGTLFLVDACWNPPGQGPDLELGDGRRRKEKTRRNSHRPSCLRWLFDEMVCSPGLPRGTPGSRDIKKRSLQTKFPPLASSNPATTVAKPPWFHSESYQHDPVTRGRKHFQLAIMAI